MKKKFIKIILMSLFVFTNQAFAIDLDIIGIKLGESMDEGITKIKTFTNNIDSEDYEFNERKGMDVDDNLVYYASLGKAKSHNDTGPIFTNLSVSSFNEKIWSVSKYESFSPKQYPLKSIVIESLKEKYGNPTHSSGLTNDVDTAILIWLYDNNDNRVEGSHNHASFSYNNDVCDFNTASGGSLLEFRQINKNPLCGKFVMARIYSANGKDQTEYASSLAIMTVDNHNYYNYLVDQQNTEQEKIKKAKEEQLKNAEKFKPTF